MTNHRDDDTNDAREAPLDPRLLEAARAYNAPPAATPREAMWERIAAARGARAVEQPPAAVKVIPLAPRTAHDGRGGGRRPAWALPLAAALLLGVGVGVGRLSVTRDGVAPTTAPVAVAVPDTPAGESPAAHTTPSPSPAGRQQLAAAAPAGGSPSASSTARSRASTAERREPSAESGTATTPLAYRLATAEHLASTETLLATISADAKAGRADTSVAAWARDLLGTTRVLLDSPAGRDPKMARLLEDLELVLAQVAQMPAGRGAEELQTIERAVRRRDVMTRVRAAIPSGPLAAGT